MAHCGALADPQWPSGPHVNAAVPPQASLLAQQPNDSAARGRPLHPTQPRAGQAPALPPLPIIPLLPHSALAQSILLLQRQQQHQIPSAAPPAKQSRGRARSASPSTGPTSGRGSAAASGRGAASPQWAVPREVLRIIAAAKGVFQPCPECFDSHRGSRDSHVSIIDVDDATGRRYCHFCKPPEGAKRLVQIRRNTYSDVMRLADLCKLYDTSGIQPYTINNHRVAFLQPRPQVPKPGAAGPSCRYCHRALMDPPSCYCSLECKLNIEDGVPPLTLEQVTEMGDRRSIKIPRKLAGGGAAAANGSTAAPTASEAAEALLPPPLLDSAGSEDTAGGSPAAFAPCGFGATMAASVDGGYPESVGTAIRGRGIRGGRVRRPSPAARMAAAAAAAEDAGAGGFGGGGGSGYGVQREQGCVQQWGAGVGSYPDDDEEGGVVVKVQRGVPGRGGVPRPMGIGGFATAAAELLQPEARDEVAASGGGVRRGAGGRAGSSRSRRNSGGDGVCYGGAAGYAEGTYGRALWEEGQGGGMEADAGGRVMGPSLGLGALSALAGRLLLPQLDEQQQQHSHIRADGGCTPTRVAAGEPQEVTGHLLPATAAAAAAANETPVSLQEQHVQDIGMGITGDSTMAEQAQPAHADGRLPPGVLVPPPPAPFPLTQNGSQLPPLPRPPGGSGRSALAPLSRTGSGNVPVPRPTTNAGVGAEGLLPILPLDLVAVTAGPAGPGAGAGNGAGGGGVGGAPTANGEGHVGGEEVSASGESNNENLEQLGSSGGQHSNVFHAPSPAAGPAALRRPASSSSSCGAILPRGMHTPSASNHGGGPPVAPRPPMAPRSGVVAAAAATAAAAASGHPGVSAVTGLRTQRRVSAGALLPYARPTVSGSSTVDDDGCGGSVGLPPRPAPGPALSAGYGGGGGRAVYRAAPLLPPRQAFGPVGGGEGPKRRCVSADHGGGGASYALSGDGGGDGGAEDGQEVTSPRRRRASGAGLAAILAGRGGGSSSGGGAAVDADRLAAHLSLLSPTQHIRRHPAGRELLLPPPAVPLGGAVPAAAVFAAAGPGAAQAAAAALRSPEPMEMDTPARSGGGDGEAGGGGSPESLVGASGGRQRCKSRKGKPQQAPLS